MRDGGQPLAGRGKMRYPWQELMFLPGGAVESDDRAFSVPKHGLTLGRSPWGLPREGGTAPRPATPKVANASSYQI